MSTQQSGRLFSLKTPKEYINLSSLQVLALVLCLGNPSIKADYLFRLAVGPSFQAEVDKLIESGEYKSEEEAENDVYLGWTSSSLEHALRQMVFIGEFLPKMYF